MKGIKWVTEEPSEFIVNDACMGKEICTLWLGSIKKKSKWKLNRKGWDDKNNKAQPEERHATYACCKLWYLLY